MFSESFPQAVGLPKQAGGPPRKHVTKPFTQPAAPDYIAQLVNRLVLWNESRELEINQDGLPMSQVLSLLVEE